MKNVLGIQRGKLVFLMGIFAGVALAPAEESMPEALTAEAFYESSGVEAIPRPERSGVPISAKRAQWQEDGYSISGYTIAMGDETANLYLGDLARFVVLSTESNSLRVRNSFIDNASITITYYQDATFAEDLGAEFQTGYWRWLVTKRPNPRFVDSTDAPHAGGAPEVARPFLGGATIALEYRASFLENPDLIYQYKEILIKTDTGLIFFEIQAEAGEWSTFSGFAENLLSKWVM